MRNVEVDEDIYKYLVSNIKDFGESISDVIRRLVMAPTQIIPVPNGHHAFLKLLDDPNFINARTNSEKYLLILSEICVQKKDQFEIILGKRNRTRVNFARSKEEIINAGTSCQPRQIPRTQYWADTNNSTNQKKGLLSQVLRTLKYDSKSIGAALNSL